MCSKAGPCAENVWSGPRISGNMVYSQLAHTSGPISLTVNSTQATVMVMPEVRLVNMECSHRAEVGIGMKEKLAGDNGCDGPVPFRDWERVVSTKGCSHHQEKDQFTANGKSVEYSRRSEKKKLTSLGTSALRVL